MTDEMIEFILWSALIVVGILMIKEVFFKNDSDESFID